MKNEHPILNRFSQLLPGEGGWAKHDALIGHGGAQVGDETPLGSSLGSAELVMPAEAVSF